MENIMKQPTTKNKLLKYSLYGFFFVSILGTLSHFFYQWSRQNPIIGLFCPINESTWEHMKLLFFPMLLYYALLNQKFGSTYPSISTAYPFSILLGTCLIPILFYSYSGILGFHLMIFDILTFYISVFLAFLFFYCLVNKAEHKENPNQKGTLIKLRPLIHFLLILFFLFFLFFTYYPPKLGIFQIPAN